MAILSVSVIVRNLKYFILCEIVANLCQILYVCAIRNSELQVEENQNDVNDHSYKYPVIGSDKEESFSDSARLFKSKEVDFKQTWDLISPDNMLMISSNAFATQIFIAGGWLVSGFIYDAILLKAGASDALSVMFGPQAMMTNMFRCVVAFTFVFIGIFSKTLLTVGLSQTMDHMKLKHFEDVFDKMTSEKFLRTRILRGIIAAGFQIIGWTLFGIIMGKKDDTGDA